MRIDDLAEKIYQAYLSKHPDFDGLDDSFEIRDNMMDEFIGLIEAEKLSDAEDQELSATLEEMV